MDYSKPEGQPQPVIMPGNPNITEKGRQGMVPLRRATLPRVTLHSRDILLRATHHSRDMHSQQCSHTQDSQAPH